MLYYHLSLSAHCVPLESSVKSDTCRKLHYNCQLSETLSIQGSSQRAGFLGVNTLRYFMPISRLLKGQAFVPLVSIENNINFTETLEGSMDDDSVSEDSDSDSE